MVDKMHKKSHIPIRLNILFSVIILLFSLLIIRLIYLQILNYHTYHTMLTQTKAIQVKTDTTRGQIYDRHGELLVGNKSHTAINYTRDTLDPKKLLFVAEQLSTLISLPTDDLKERDLKDYWLVKYTDKLNSRLSEEDKKLTATQFYLKQLDYVTQEDIQFSDDEKEVVAIFTKMNSISSLSTTAIKNRDVTQEEIANVSEQIGNLSGVSIGTDWERIYPKGDLLKGLLGHVSTSATGIPATQANDYLSKGYANNTRVGTSYLEKQYDTALRGTPKVVSYQLNSDNQIVSSTDIYEGQIGSNLVLTIDSQLQSKVDDILTGFLQQSIDERGLNNSVYAVVQKVDTGEILAVSGKKYGYSEQEDTYTTTIEDDILGTINSTFTMGSVVKAATVGIGYEYGIISENNNILVDIPITFKSDGTISSYFNQKSAINLDDQMALAQSSNIYMSRIALAMGGQSDFQNGSELAITEDTITKMRKSYATYGLGSNTGIDLPNASRGYSPINSPLIGAVYLSFGQYDLYSPLQISQYMSTIANGGTRYATHLGKEIREMNNVDGIGQVQTDISPTIMNKLNITSSQLNRIHQGLYQVTHHYLGTEFENYSQYPIQVSGKTGTAETIYGGPLKSQVKKGVLNSVFSGYAPSSAPEINVTVVIPYVDSINSYAGQLSKQIFNAYFKQ